LYGSRQPLPLRQLDQRIRERGLTPGHVMELHLDRETVRKDVAPALEQKHRLRRTLASHVRRHLTGRGARQAPQTVRTLCNVLERELGPATIRQARRIALHQVMATSIDGRPRTRVMQDRLLGRVQHVAPPDLRRRDRSATRIILQLPRLDTTDARTRDQPGEVAIAALVAHEEGRGMTVHLQLRPDDRLDPLRVWLEREADDAAQVRCVGQAERTVAELGSPRDELLGAARSVAEGVGTVGPELCVHRLPAVEGPGPPAGLQPAPGAYRTKPETAMLEPCGLPRRISYTKLSTAPHIDSRPLPGTLMKPTIRFGLALLLASVCPAAAQQGAQLQVGQTVSATLSPSDTVRYVLELPAGHFVAGRVEQEQ